MGVDKSILRGALRQRAEQPEAAEAERVEGATVPDFASEAADWTPADSGHDAARGIAWPGIALALLALLALGWVALYASVELIALPALTTGAAVEHLTALTPPLLLLLLLALFVQRGAAAELRRQEKASGKLHASGEALAEQAETVRLRIDAMRETVEASVARLDALGDDTLARMADNAAGLERALGVTEEKAKALHRISDTATHNVAKLNRDTPALIGYARDIADTIADTGKGAAQQLRELEAGLHRLAEAEKTGQREFEAMREASDSHFDALIAKLEAFDAQYGEKLAARRVQAEEMTDAISDGVDAAGDKMVAHFAESDVRVAALLDKAQSASRNLVSALDGALQDAKQRTDALIEQLSASGEKFDSMDARRMERLREQLDELGLAIDRVSEIRGKEADALNALVDQVDGKYDEASQRIDALVDRGSEQAAKLAFALEATDRNIDQLAGSLDMNKHAVDNMIERNRQLADVIGSNAQALSEALPAHVARFAERLSEVGETISEQASLARDMEHEGERLVVQFGKLDRRISQQHDALQQLAELGHDSLSGRREEAEALNALLREARGALADIAAEGEGELDRLLERMRSAGREAADVVRQGLSQMDEDSAISAMFDEKALPARARARADEIRAAFVESFEHGLDQAGKGAAELEGKLSLLEDMIQALEARIEAAEEEFEPADDEGFARRMAILTESLNSASIDIARVLSTEVSDTAWESYLKGDRSIFTRRALRLLDTQETKAVLEQYEWNNEFRSQVNRYIHDFEAMMRQLLSTRDGHRISVTLLSSDMGKLYVALAQAIERLRS